MGLDGRRNRRKWKNQTRKRGQKNANKTYSKKGEDEKNSKVLVTSEYFPRYQTVSARGKQKSRKNKPVLNGGHWEQYGKTEPALMRKEKSRACQAEKLFEGS